MTRLVRLGLGSVMAVVVLGVVCCGRDAEPEIPAWAKVSPEQIAEAKRHGVPVALENNQGMRFVLVPSGTFVMGSPESETKDYDHPEWWKDERPQHRVALSRPFYMQITEVTNGEYRRFKPLHDSEEYKGHSLNGEKQPVVEVSWEDATAYAEWLTKRDGKRTYELPTEAEWEYACRAGTTTRYSWGDGEEDADRYANGYDAKTKGEFGFDWDAFPRDDGHRVSAPVGSYRPNGWGLYDLHGNVWEWCRDRYGEYPSGEVTDPSGPSSGTWRALRGGSWRNGPGNVRSANRDGFVPGRRLVNDGFRLVSPLPSGG